MNNLVNEIRKEIVRRYDEWNFPDSAEAKHRREALVEIMEFIDSIDNPLDYEHATIINTDFAPKDEEPKNKDFKDFVKSYMSANDDNILHFYDRYAGLVDGAQWQKEQMTKDVVEAELYLDGDFLTLDYDFVQLGMKHGDKVKVIIIKDE